MDLYNIRRDFSLKTLDEADAISNPIEMLNLWLDNAIEAKALEPTAMTVSTVSTNGRPSSRVVLLKHLTDEGLEFFTNYDSKKGIEISENGYVAINFIWHELERQVRIDGIAAKLSEEQSVAYFNMRPRSTRIGAWASPQSHVIKNREYLDNQVEKYTKAFDNKEIPKPLHWGGYIIKPELFEFWQGRSNRLHDRLQYTKVNEGWKIERLAP
mgnify:CR=1 FL=1